MHSMSFINIRFIAEIQHHGTYMHSLGGNVDHFASSLFCLWLIDMSRTKLENTEGTNRQSREIGNTR
jgi:hypothetical protein